jgi:uncharacterized protein
MSANIALLLPLNFALDKAYLSFLVADLRSRPVQKILAGIFSALLLYLIFYAGNYLCRAILPFAAGEVARVYSFRQNASTLRIFLLMFFLIGPGEELFWRGFIQRHWQNRFGPIAGWLCATALYSLVHLGSGNVMLVFAALICGLFWGALFLRYGSPLLVAVSHTLWDLLIFVALPLECGPR